MDPPTFAKEPQDAWFKLMDSAFLLCVVNPYSLTVSYRWTFNGEIVFRYENLTKIEVFEYGAYNCLVSNSFGTIVSRTAQVKAPS